MLKSTKLALLVDDTQEEMASAPHGDQFAIEQVAEYEDEDRARLMQDSRIIRNHLVEAAISNARTLLDIRVSHGSFKRWLDQYHP